jgi:hypothetical protein
MKYCFIGTGEKKQPREAAEKEAQADRSDGMSGGSSYVPFFLRFALEHERRVFCQYFCQFVRALRRFAQVLHGHGKIFTALPDHERKIVGKLLERNGR